MMNFLPQGYSFQSDSNPYQHQFISPFYGSGQYGWQYSPMAQTGPRLPTCEAGTCPPWLPPGLIATPSSGVQELSVLFDPTLAARMSRAYNAWTIGYWGKPDIPAWLWPDGSAPGPVPPNVCCEVPPCVGPGGYGGGGGGGGGGGSGMPGPGPGPIPSATPGPGPIPQATPRPGPIPKATPTPGPGPKITTVPGPRPGGPKLTPGPVPSGPGIGAPPGPSSAQPNPRRMFNPRWGRASAPRIMFSQMPMPSPPARLSARPATRGGPKCYTAPDKGACYKCCAEHGGGKQCLDQCLTLPTPKPKGQGGGPRRTRNASERSRAGRLARSRARRGHPPGRERGWCGPGEHLCIKKSPSGGKSNFCCCDSSGSCVGGKIVLA